MIKLKISAVITILLGVISIGWIFYDYIALTDIVYEYGEQLVEKRRIITLGFIPIILFHFAFFLTMYFLFDFLKKQKSLIKEHKLNKAELNKFLAEKEQLEKDKAGKIDLTHESEDKRKD